LVALTEVPAATLASIVMSPSALPTGVRPKPRAMQSSGRQAISAIFVDLR